MARRYRGGHIRRITSWLDPATYGGINYNPLHFSGAIGRYFTVGAKYTFN